MIFGYTGCTLAEGRAPRGRDPSADSAAGIRRGRAQLAPRWTSNPGDNALNPGGLGAAPPTQQRSFPCFSAGVNQTRSRAGIGSGQRMLKRFKAPLQFCTGMVHFFEAFRKAKYSSFMAASSFGNDPRILMILRSDMFSDSIVLVV